MSHHVRTYSGGAALHDVRRKTYAVFHCDVCGEDEDVDITGRQDNFQFHIPRRCPHCKNLGKEDHVLSLKKEIEQLSISRTNIDVAIERLTRQLEQLSEEKV